MSRGWALSPHTAQPPGLRHWPGTATPVTLLTAPSTFQTALRKEEELGASGPLGGNWGDPFLLLHIGVLIRISGKESVHGSVWKEKGGCQHRRDRNVAWIGWCGSVRSADSSAEYGMILRGGGSRARVFLPVWDFLWLCLGRAVPRLISAGGNTSPWREWMLTVRSKAGLNSSQLWTSNATQLHYPPRAKCQIKEKASVPSMTRPSVCRG